MVRWKSSVYFLTHHFRQIQIMKVLQEGKGYDYRSPNFLPDYLACFR